MKAIHTAQHKAAYIAAQQDYLQHIAQHCDYAITLQTSLRTAGINPHNSRLSHKSPIESLQDQFPAVAPGAFAFKSHSLTLFSNNSVQSSLKNWIFSFWASLSIPCPAQKSTIWKLPELPGD